MLQNHVAFTKHFLKWGFGGGYTLGFYRPKKAFESCMKTLQHTHTHTHLTPVRVSKNRERFSTHAVYNFAFTSTCLHFYAIKFQRRCLRLWAKWLCIRMLCSGRPKQFTAVLTAACGISSDVLTWRNALFSMQAFLFVWKHEDEDGVEKKVILQPKKAKNFLRSRLIRICLIRIPRYVF